MRAAVQQVFTLQIKLGVAAGGEVFAQRQRRRAARVVLQQIDKFRLKCRIALGADKGFFQLFQGRHQNLRHVLATKFAEVGVKQRHESSRYYPLLI